MKFECIFASIHAKNPYIQAKSIRTFLCSGQAVYQQIYGLLPPHGVSDTLVLGMILGGIAGGNSLFCINIHSNTFPIMPRIESICEGAKHSNTNARRSSARTASRVSMNQGTDKSSEQLLIELAEAFEAEKKAKNTAYYFILSNGLLDRFADFCKNYHSRDPHRDCVEYLLSKC